MNAIDPDRRWHAPDITAEERENDGLSQALWNALEGQVLDDSVDESSAESSFEEGVAARIDEAQRKLQHAPAFARRAALFLPPFLLPKAMAPLASTAGSVGSKSSTGFLPGILTLPALTVAMVLFSAIALVRFAFQKGQHGPQSGNQRASQLEIADWWRANLFKTLAVIALLLWSMFHYPVDTLVVAMSLSTLALFGLLGRLSSAGLATRREVGRVSYQFLYFAALFGWQFTQGETFGFDSQVGRGWVLPVLGTGAALCYALLKGHRRAWILAGTVLSVVVLAIQLLDRFTGQHPVDMDRALALLEDPEEADHFRVHSDWSDWAIARGLLEAAGEEVKPWRGLERGMRLQMETDLAKSDFNTLYAYPMLELGALAAEDIPALRSDYAFEVMFDRGKHYSLRHDDIQVRLRMLGEDFSDSEKRVLADRILKQLKRDNELLRIEDLWMGTRTLEALDFHQQVDALAPIAHHLLRQTYQVTKDGKMAWFVGSPSLVDSGSEMPSSRYASFVPMEDTCRGLLAIHRWGLPEGIALAPIEKYLKKIERVYSWESPPQDGVLAASGRKWLAAPLAKRTEAGQEHEPGWWQTLLSYRLLLAAILLAVGGVWATARATPDRA